MSTALLRCPEEFSAFNLDTGAFLGQLTDPDGQLIAIPGLWEMIFPMTIPATESSIRSSLTPGPMP